MEIPDKIPGKIATKVTISGIVLEDDSPWGNEELELVKIPDWLFKFITKSISNAYEQGQVDKIQEIKKVLRIKNGND